MHNMKFIILTILSVEFSKLSTFTLLYNQSEGLFSF